MGRFAVLVESFAVVRQEHHQRAVPPSTLDQRVFEPAQFPVHVFQLRIVARCAAGPGAGRNGVRRMQVEKMDENENGLAALRAQPALGGAHHQRRGPAVAHGVAVRGVAGEKHRTRERREGVEAEGAVVEVEALVQAHLAFEENAADERGGLVALRVQHGGQSHGARRQRLGVLLDPVFEGISRGEQRGVRGQRQRNLRIHGREHSARLGVGVDVRRVNERVAVGAEVVRAEGVDGNQDNRRGRHAPRPGARLRQADHGRNADEQQRVPRANRRAQG